jgi:hypothetical protein
VPRRSSGQPPAVFYRLRLPQVGSCRARRTDSVMIRSHCADAPLVGVDPAFSSWKRSGFSAVQVFPCLRQQYAASPAATPSSAPSLMYPSCWQYRQCFPWSPAILLSPTGEITLGDHNFLAPFE